jgi:hypothetical protein
MRRLREGASASGNVVRSLAATARTRVETFSLRVDGLDDSDLAEPSPVEHLIGEFRFHGTVGEPILIWDGPIGEGGSREKALDFFSGNVAREKPQGTTILNAAGLDPLPDGEFWPIIDSLGGRMWERTITAAARQLSEYEDDHILRWAETAGLRALALSDALEAAGIAPINELDVIGASLGRGKASYSRVLADPDSFDPRWLADNSSQVIWIGAHALDRQLDGEVRLETTFTARQRDINDRAREQLEQNRRDRGFPPERRETSYRAARAVIEEGAGFRERLVLFPDDGPAAQSTERAEHAAASFGGTVVAVELDWNPGTVGLTHGDIFTIKRRSPLPVPEYIPRHTTAPEPNEVSAR